MKSKRTRPPRPTITLPPPIDEAIEKIQAESGRTKNGTIIYLLGQALGIPAEIKMGRPYPFQKQPEIDDEPFEF